MTLLNSKGEKAMLTRRALDNEDTPWWQPMLFGAMAGGLAWGIRGQYGHETGAMMAGLLVSLTLVYLLCWGASSSQVVRAVAWTTIAMGVGGSMTYGQTLGLTQNPPVIGNWAALGWGLLGCAVKGGLWIGFAGVFLGMGLSGVRYRPIELLLLTLGLVAVYILGMTIFNSPFDIENKRLPLLYFSSAWRWEPGADIEPRREYWGGMVLALAAVAAYVRIRRKDTLALRMALWGLLGGAVGFPLGQSLQAWHAWNAAAVSEALPWLSTKINWWNMMETTFGATMGGTLGLGLWLNRERIQPANDPKLIPSEVGALLLVAHLILLVGAEFLGVPIVEPVYDMGIIMIIIPVVAVAGGRWWSYWMLLPVTLLPIAVKTVLFVGYEAKTTHPGVAWIAYFAIPMAVVIAAAVWFARLAEAGGSARRFSAHALLLSVWTLFFLNFAIFDYSWPWSEWTARTPNAIIFAVFALGLTGMVVVTELNYPEQKGSRPNARSEPS